MRVLVTGHRGFIGSVMTAVLRHARYEVVGLDCDFYDGCDFGRTRQDIPSHETDLRDVEFTDLLPFDAVVHLAALPVEQASQLDPGLVAQVNEEATLRLAECCKQAGVSRLLFASSCDVYAPRATAVNEHAPVEPLSDFAASKLRCERVLEELADDTFTPVCLRHAEVFGVAPRFRADLRINEFVASAVTGGEVTLHSDGRVFTSVIHVEDLCRVYASLLMMPDDRLWDTILNVAAPGQDYRLIEIADLVTELIPPAVRHFAPEQTEEPGYRVDVARLRQALPNLSFRWTLPLGIRQLANAIQNAGITPADLRSGRYHRVLRLQSLVDRGDVDRTLRRRNACRAVEGQRASL